MSEIDRILSELGATLGADWSHSVADRQLVVDALRHYGEHLLITGVTVRTVKPSGADRKAVANYFDIVSGRANDIAALIEVSASLTINRCGEY